MSSDSGLKEIRHELRSILLELRSQTDLADRYPENSLSFQDEMNQIQEFIDANEYGIALESILSNLKEFSFSLTGKSAVRLVKIASLMKYHVNVD